ncbi:MAG: putative TrmH family tRNA/rRNA methyltransferase [Firmicutes bacterium]|nr:putative TrmH family tRNA/rRNA methyltransferase [Bacillota bacterium]MBT9152350.1 putative TrmH family tRNA/rRNA methyltransferase [Bacillota bacterium]
MEQVEGRNPVLEALKAGKEVDKIFLQKGAIGSVRQIIELAKNKGAVVVEAEKALLDKMSEGRPHQGVIARLAIEEYADFDSLVEKAKASEHPLLIILDHLEDPHNFGAILRTALAAGAQGVIIPKRRSVALTPAVAKASAGATAHLPVARVANLAQHVELLKEQGFWVVGAEESGKVIYETKQRGPLAVIFGNEGEGLSRLLKERCDELVSVPMLGPVSSLNVAVSCGVVLFEMVRQRRA